MIKLLIKHIIYELCIDVLFEKLYNNFIKSRNPVFDAEDSIILTNIRRSNEKRIWKIDVGKMPRRGREADEHMNKMIQGLHRSVNYNQKTIECSKY